MQLLSCTAEITGDDQRLLPPREAAPQGAAPEENKEGGRRVRRLSHARWEQSAIDLLELTAPPGVSGHFAADALAGSVFDSDQSALVVGRSLFDDYQSAAESLAGLVTSDAASVAKLVPADLPTDPALHRRELVRHLAVKAYRRPVLEREVDELEQLYRRGSR